MIRFWASHADSIMVRANVMLPTANATTGVTRSILLASDTWHLGPRSQVPSVYAHSPTHGPMPGRPGPARSHRRDLRTRAATFVRGRVLLALVRAWSMAEHAVSEGRSDEPAPARSEHP